jgi:hypothetical protein
MGIDHYMKEFKKSLLLLNTSTTQQQLNLIACAIAIEDHLNTDACLEYIDEMRSKLNAVKDDKKYDSLELLNIIQEEVDDFLLNSMVESKIAA